MCVLLFIKAYSRIPFPKNTYEGPLLTKFFSTIEVRLTSAGVASTLLVCRFLFTAVTSSSAKCGECVSCCAWSKRSSSFLISLCSDWKEIFLKLNKWSNSYRCSLAGIWYILKVKNKNTISICKKPPEHRMCSDRTEDIVNVFWTSYWRSIYACFQRQDTRKEMKG